MTNDRITGPCPECAALRAKLAEAEATILKMRENTECLCTNCNDELDPTEPNWCASCHIGYTELIIRAEAAEAEVARLTGQGIILDRALARISELEAGLREIVRLPFECLDDCKDIAQHLLYGRGE